MKELKGITPIVAATFKDNGEMDYESLSSEVRFLIEQGAAGLVLFGLSTEFYMLSDDERMRMVETVVKAAEGRVPVVAQTTSNSTYCAVCEAKRYADAGTDINMCFAPLMRITTTALMMEHLKSVANAVDLPFAIQYTQGATAAIINPSDMLLFSKEIKCKLYVKAEAQSPLSYVKEICELSQGSIGVLAGLNALHFVELMDRGLIGAMPGVSAMKAYVKIYNTYMAGDKEESRRLYKLLLPFICKTIVLPDALQDTVFFEKKVLEQRGIIKSAHIRKPGHFSNDKQNYLDFLESRTWSLKAMEIDD